MRPAITAFDGAPGFARGQVRAAHLAGFTGSAPPGAAAWLKAQGLDTKEDGR